MNTLYASNTNSKILITCPHCKIGSRYDGSYVEDAIKIRHDIVCVACGEVFNLVVSIPISEAVEHNAHPTVLPHSSTAAHCPHCQGQIVIGLPETAQRVA